MDVLYTFIHITFFKLVLPIPVTNKPNNQLQYIGLHHNSCCVTNQQIHYITDVKFNVNK